MTTTGQNTRNDVHTYRGPGGAGRPNLTGLPGVHRHEDGDPRVLEVERYDTEGRALAAAGVALAVRRDGVEQPRWRLDLPDDRVETPVAPGAAVPEVPAEIAELLRGTTRGRDLRPAGRVRTVRSRSRLFGDEDAVLAEVTHDDVTVAVLGAAADVRAWSEADVRASGELLTALEARLAEVGLAPAAHAGEAELDRLLRPEPARRRTGRRGSAGEALLSYLAAQVDRIAAEEIRVRRGEPDSVHQLRVAARRLRSALQAYRPLLDRGRTEPLVDGLRELGQALAPARDVEVLQEGIADRLAALDPALRMGQVHALVTRHFAREEAEANAAALSYLDGERYTRLRTALDELLRRPPLTKQARGKAAETLPGTLARTGRRMRKAVDAAVAAGPDERDVATHSARKAGKRLRYATEVARPVVGKPAKRFAKSLKPLHKALGNHQDAVVAGDALRLLGAQAHTDGENGFALGILHAQGEATKARIERDLPDLWRRAWTRRTTAWLR
jgi:CHAD domain-containing protein